MLHSGFLEVLTMRRVRVASKGAKRKLSEELRVSVATFNLRQLTILGPDISSHAKSIYQRKRAWIAEQLERMGCPDLVALQEVSDKVPILDILNSDRLRNYRRRNPQVVMENDGKLGIKNAVISCLPVLDWWSIEEIPRTVLDSLGTYCSPNDKFLRPVLVVLVKFPGGAEVEFWNIHLKSRRGILKNGESGSCPYAHAVSTARALVVRATEAVGVRHLYLKALERNRRPIILAGDINDVLHSVTSETITGEDPWKRLPHSDKNTYWDRKLNDVRNLQPRRQDAVSRDYTYIFNGKQLSLDRILASNHFSVLNQNHIGWVESVRTFNDHLVDETACDLDDWMSDHGQLVATMRIGPYHYTDNG